MKALKVALSILSPIITMQAQSMNPYKQPTPKEVTTMVSNFLSAHNEEFENEMRERIRNLILHGMNPNIPTTYGSYLLDAFAARHEPEMVKFLLDKGADPNRQTEYNRETALLRTIKFSQIGRTYEKEQVVQLLLNRGANPDLKNKDGAGPLAVAIWVNDPQIVQLLLEYGANPLITDGSGTSALQIAIIEGKPAIAQLLRNAIEGKQRLG